MSSFNEILGAQEVGTEAAQEYNELLNRTLFGELTINTSQIILSLSEEPNDVPKEEIIDNKEDHDGLFVEEGNGIIRIRVLSPDNHSKISVDLSTDENDLFPHTITPETYKRLQELTVDPEVAMINAKSKLKNAI